MALFSITSGSTITNLTLISGGTVTVANTGSLADSQANSTLTLQGGNLALNGAVSVTNASGVLALSASGTATQSAAMTVASLVLSGSGSFDFENTSNSVGTLAGGSGTPIGSLTFVNSGALTVGAVGSANGIAASGAISLTVNGSAADITVSQEISTTYSGFGNGITLTAGRDILLPSSTNSLIVANSATGTAINLIAARNIDIFGGIEAFVGQVTLQAGSDTNANATITEEQGALGVIANQLLLTTAATSLANAPDVMLGDPIFYGDPDNTDSGTTIGTVAAYVHSLDLVAFQGSLATMTIGTVGGVSGISAAGPVRLGTYNGPGLVSSSPISTTGDLTIYTGAFSVGSSISAGGTLSVISGAVTVQPNASAPVSAGTFYLDSGTSWTQIQSTLSSFSATNFILEGEFFGTPAATFVRATSGDGSSTHPYVITDIYGLAGAGSLPTKNYKLGGDIATGDTSSWYNGTGFLPLGEDNQGNLAQFSGTIDGNGHTVSGLTINQSTASYSVGLISDLTGTVKNLTLTGVNISGQSDVGGIAGTNEGTISNSSVSGTISGLFAVGGIAGANNSGGVITGSSSSATIAGYDGTGGNYTFDAGGLAGDNYGQIVNSFASGNVSGFSVLGGLVGYNPSSGSITASYATGSVTAPYAPGALSNIGGLVGVNIGTIDSSHATGNVNGTIPDIADYAGGNWNYGGLVGMNLGTISNSWASGNVTGMDSVGGLVGANAGTDPQSSTAAGGTITNSYAIGAVTGLTEVGGLVGINGDIGLSGTITDSHATGTVSGIFLDPPNDTRSSNNIGGLVGENPGEVARSYATGDVGGSSNVGGLIGSNDSGSSAHEVYATGNVTGSASENVGGLIGTNNGTVLNAYATGSVSGDFYVGGLVGVMAGGSLTSVYSTRS